MRPLSLVIILSALSVVLVGCVQNPSKNDALLEEQKTKEEKYSHLQEAYQKSQEQKVQNVIINEEDYPYATAIPGKQGYVLSPYSQKALDVRNQKSGDLVLDPYYARSEKKYFRIP